MLKLFTEIDKGWKWKGSKKVIMLYLMDERKNKQIYIKNKIPCPNSKL